MHNFKKLHIWILAMDLSVQVYKLIEGFPVEEKYGLKSQIQRSAVSIPSNIAEGAGRQTNNDFNKFIGIAVGSAFELETQLILANRLGFIDESDQKDILNLLSELQAKTIAFSKSLKRNS